MRMRLLYMLECYIKGLVDPLIPVIEAISDRQSVI